MKNTQKGFIVPLIIGIVAVLIIAGGVYFAFEKGKSAGVNQVNTSVIPANAGIQSQTSGSNSSTASSTTTQPAPVITSINPSSGPIGTIVELKGNNLAGFEGELNAWIENSKGEKAFLPGIGSVPRADQTIRVKIDSQLCKENLSYKGGQCSSHMTITPGTYKIYTYPWGNMSNTVQFTVTASNSSVTSTAWQTYTNTRYGFEFKYPANQGLVSQEQQNDNLGPTGTIISDSSTKKPIFLANGGGLTIANNISDLLNNVKSGSSTPTTIQPGLVTTVSQTTISGKPAVVRRTCNQGVCGQVISIPDFTIKKIQYGQTMYEDFTILFAENDLTLKMLSTFKFTNN